MTIPKRLLDAQASVAMCIAVQAMHGPEEFHLPIPGPALLNDSDDRFGAGGRKATLSELSERPMSCRDPESGKLAPRAVSFRHDLEASAHAVRTQPGVPNSS